MKNKKLSFFSVILAGFLPYATMAAEYDTADPMYLTQTGDFLSSSSMSFTNDILRLSQVFSYGLNNRLSLSADLKYQQDFNGDEDGFSNIGIGGVYRLSGSASDESNIISDALFGINFGGSTHVRSPDFADTIYHAGMRVGRQWSRFTLAGTIKSSWIFDEVRGMAYIDLIPQAYVRITESWMAGLDFNLRKSTNPNFDQEWLGLRLVRRYGKTEYIGHIDYEFESEKYQFGVRVNILF